MRNAYIQTANWGSDNQYVTISQPSEAGAIIEITHYFDYHATITVFIVYVWYDNRNMMHVGSMEKFFMISCIGSTATLNETHVRMSVNSQFQLRVQASGYSSESPRWSTSNSSIASVTTSGLVTGRRAGNATITCDPIVGPPVSCSFEIYTPSSPGDGGGGSGGSGDDDGSGDSGGDDGSGGSGGDDGSGGSGESGGDDSDGDNSFQETMIQSAERLKALQKITSKYIDNNRIW